MSTRDDDLPSVDELLLWLLDGPAEDGAKIERDLVAAGVDVQAAYAKLDAQIAASRAAAGRRRLERAAHERRGANLRRPRSERYADLSMEALRARVAAGRATLGHRDFSKLSRADLESLLDDLDEEP